MPDLNYPRIKKESIYSWLEAFLWILLLVFHIYFTEPRLTYEKELRQEKIRVVAEYSEQQGIEVARQKALQELQKKLKNNKPVGKTKMDILSSPSEPIIRVKLIVETSENIAIAKPIIDEEIVIDELM